MRTSFQQWRSTLYLPFAPQPTGRLAHAHRPLSNWNLYLVWNLNCGSSTRTWPWRSSPSMHRRTVARWSGKDHQRGEFRSREAPDTHERISSLVCRDAKLVYHVIVMSLKKRKFALFFLPCWINSMHVIISV